MEVTVHRGNGKFQQVIDIGPHTLLSDAPKIYDGEEAGPSPHDLLAAALGACTALTIMIYAEKKNLELQDVKVRIEHSQQDSEYIFSRHIEYIGGLSSEEQQRLTDIANKCPVHKTLMGAIKIVTEVT